MRKQFELKNEPIGDAYHLLTVAFLLRRAGEEVAVRFTDSPKGQELFHFLEIDLPVPGTGDPTLRLSDTAKIIKKCYSPGCLDALGAKSKRPQEANLGSFRIPNLRRKILSSLSGNAKDTIGSPIATAH